MRDGGGSELVQCGQNQTALVAVNKAGVLYAAPMCVCVWELSFSWDSLAIQEDQTHGHSYAFTCKYL